MDCSSSNSSEPAAKSARPEFTKEQEATIFHAAGRRVTATVRREQPPPARVALGTLAETPVYGAFVSLKRQGKLRSCCGCIESSMPLCDALDRAADRAATDDPRFPPIIFSELNQLDMDVWILWNPEPVAARGSDRINAVVIGKHGLLISRGPARGLLLPGVAVEHNLDALSFLQHVCMKAGLPTDAWKDDATSLLVFEGDSIHGRLMPNETDVRQAAVAGTFYPADVHEMSRMVDEMIAAAGPTEPQTWSGAMVPHAGWMYSGRLAAAVFTRIKVPGKVIILCPKHRPGGAAWAVAPHRRWLFPGGGMPSDPELAAKLARAVPGLKLDAAAHRDEHAIEVQLPLLCRVAPLAQVVGITVGGDSLAELLRFGIELAGLIRDMPERPLLIASSDMNHFEDDAHTRRVDRLVLDAIASLDPAYVYETVRRNQVSMCGVGPCVIVMETLRRLGCLNRCEQIGYATSAEAGGPKDRVVGYAGLLFG